jgi:eukaryotic-like serine/threonine-protein kinase
VQLVPVETADVAVGRVTAVTPEGELSPGALVTVSHAVQPPPPPAVEAEEADDGEGNNGNGKGRGNGRGGGKDDD